MALAASRADLNATIQITSDPDLVARADRIVLPGQGAFADCAAGLKSFDGLEDSILTRVNQGAAFLGICVGMQLMAERGLEHQATPGFGWIKGDIAKIPTTALRLPQMGWNELQFEPNSHPILNHLIPGDHAYFVHSYALTNAKPAHIIATTNYDGPIPAIIATANRAGTQFHAEKSQAVGLQILENFLRWEP